MANHSLIPMMLKKVLEPFHNLKQPFSNFWNGAPTISFTEEKALLPDPDIDIFETDEKFHITAYVPDLEKDDIHIELDKGMLILRGAKKIEKKEMRFNYHIIEHANVYFNHRVQLPNGIDENDVQATMKNGVVDIILPKSTKTHSKNNPTKSKTIRV